MVDRAHLIIIGISVGVAAGIIIACVVFFGIRWCQKHSRHQIANEHSAATLPMRTNGLGTSIDYSASIAISEVVPKPKSTTKSFQFPRWSHPDRDGFASGFGIQRYLYKDIQKATQNFTIILGQGSFGPVYKATMPSGEVIAVKMLASNSTQGEKEFQTEVILLGRLHHRNLVNLLGYCVDKGQCMLLYEYMSNGSLANLLYGEEKQALNWDERLQIALDISHGIEYLHEGAVPPVVHRDLKTANILLDHSMRAKVADFGLSKEEVVESRCSSLKGTYGYMDPAYISTNNYTVKSDIYSFGVILFELITAIHPHQNLLEYINLASMSSDGVDEILDEQLVGKCDAGEVRGLARVAHKCLHKTPRKRPSVGEICQSILRIRQAQGHSRADTGSFADADLSQVVSQIEVQQVELSKMASMNGMITV